MPSDAAQMQYIGFVNYNAAVSGEKLTNGCNIVNAILSSMRHHGVLFCIGVLGGIYPCSCQHLSGFYWHGMRFASRALQKIIQTIQL